jgi:predicted transcriptional regulator
MIVISQFGPMIDDISYGAMSEMGKDKKKSINSATNGKDAAANEPLWGKALEDMYAAVVEEPLPQSLLDLLEKLDRQPSAGSRADD